MHIQSNSMGKLFGAAVALLIAVPAAAQVSYSEAFTASANGWTGFTWYSGATSCGGSGGAMRKNLYSSVTTGALISPLTGTSFAGSTTITYDYKICDWSANTVGTLAPFGTIDCQYGATAAGPWTTIASFTDEVQSGTCISKMHTFTPPAGPLYIRFNCTRSTGTTDAYWNFDNVSISELTGPCTGTPTPGDTTGPSEACSGGTFVLGLQNATSGTGVTYQWYSSTASAAGPWNAVGSGLATLSASQTVPTWYYCDVGCAAVNSSNVLYVPMSSPSSPQGFDTGTVTPNCWSVSALVGSNLPNYDTSTAFGVGTGSVQFDYWNISAGNQPVLTSPEFTPTVAGDQVYFDAAGAIWSGSSTSIDEVILEESNDAGANWTTVVQMTNAPVGGVLNTGGAGGQFFPTASQWSSLAYPLTIGTNQIRFRGIAHFGNNVFFDNISVGVLPSARHTVYGSSCASPAMTLNAAPAPVSGSLTGTTVVYSLNNIPLACPSPSPVYYFGIAIISLGQDFPGTDLLTGYGIDAPGCKLYVTSVDATIGFVDVVANQTFNFDVPSRVPGGFLFYTQAVALICPAAPNNAGLILSNGVRSFVNDF